MTTHIHSTPVGKRLRAVALVVATAGGLTVAGTNIASGQSAAVETTFVSIAPCRLIDTRPGEANNVGPRDTPIGDAEVGVFNAHDGLDDDSSCVIPTAATAVAANVVAVAPTARGYLAVYPGDVDNPGTATLNFVAGQAPTPNAATIPLAPDGSFKVFNAFGSTHAVIDISGYFVPSSAVGSGGIGPQGPEGPQGPPGPAGESVVPASRFSLRVIDPDMAAGYYTSTAIGANGNPIVSYAALVAGQYRVAACHDPACATATISPIALLGTGASKTSIDVRPNGNPIISLYDTETKDLRVAACHDPLCTASALSTVDSVGDVGKWSAIAIGPNGRAVVSYYDATESDLKVAACDDVTCSSATVRAIDTAGMVGGDTSIAIDASGKPVISYSDSTNGDLKVAVCGDPTCSTATLRVLDSAGNVGDYTSVAIGPGGNPVVSYSDHDADDLKLAVCGDPTCASVAVDAIDTDGKVGAYTSITIGHDGSPIVSYYDETNQRLKVAACGDPTCSTTTTTTVADGSVGKHASIVIDPSGNPAIASFSPADGLMMTTCGNSECRGYTGYGR